MTAYMPVARLALADRLVYECEVSMTNASFPELSLPSRILLGPGPSNIHPRVYKAMMSPMLGYFDMDFLKVMDGVSAMLRLVFQTRNDMTLAITGTGTKGMEASVLNLLEPGDTGVICTNGFFGERMAQIAERSGAKIVMVQFPWGQLVDEDVVRKELKKHAKVKVLAVVHGETSTGVLQPLEGLSKLAKEHNALLLADAVASLGGCPVLPDQWGVDFCFSATQKCIGAPPSLSPITVSEKGTAAIDGRKEKVRSFYADLALMRKYWTTMTVRPYHHTAPTTSIYGLYEALRVILDEGLEARFERHRRNGAAFRAGIGAIGLKIFAPEGHRMDQLHSVVVPDGVDAARVKDRILKEHNIEIGAGIGAMNGKIWRVGFMGESSTMGNVMLLLRVMEKVLSQEGFKLPMGEGVAAAQKAFLGA